MRKSLLVLFTFLVIQVTQGQSFEGIISYSVDFEFKNDFVPIKDEIFNKLKVDGDYYDTIMIFIKGDQYKKVDNRINPVSIIYSPNNNDIYSLQHGLEYVTIIDANKASVSNLSLPEPIISKVDSSKPINNIFCDAIKLEWDKLGEEWYFYNKEIATIDPDLYAKHNCEYLNLILKTTGSYPLEIVKILNNMMQIRMSFISVQEKKLSDSIFAIPELKKADKKTTKLTYEVSGNKIMKIKN
jgi:hypothetical protein